jgi:ABC-type branched-subunit amino acid transport system substrate-binding protein
MLRTIFIAVLLWFLPSQALADPIKIGASFALSGKLSASGQAAAQGAALAVAEINGASGS